MKRSNQKIITLKARVLRHLRLSRKISQREVGRRCGVSEAAVGHYENGRMDVSESRLKQFLELYKYDREEFDEYLNGEKAAIIGVKGECIRLIEELDDHQLNAIHVVLREFLSKHTKISRS